MQFENPNDFHRHELNGPSLRTFANHRVSIEMDQRLRDCARKSECDVSIVYRHALFEYLQARGIDCLKPIGCV